MPFGDPWRSRGQTMNDEMEFIMKRLDQPAPLPSPYMRREAQYAQDVPQQGQGVGSTPPASQIPQIPVSATYRPEQIKYAPLLGKEADRKQAILNNAPATFDVAQNPEAKSGAPIYEWKSCGTDVVRDNEKIIQEMAAKSNIDPNLLRSVV